jgi:indolepyruvate decarboxylase
VLDAVASTKRPGYIEVPRHILRANARPVPGGRPTRPQADPAAVQEAMAEALDRIRRSARLVVYAGVETERFRLRSSLIALVERLGAPVVTSIEGKAVFPEDHPNFVGLYMGQAGSRTAQELVEGSDCLLMLGAFLTDVNTGQYTAHIDRSRVIWASAEHLSIGHHIYPDISLVDVVEHLLAAPDLGSHIFYPPAPAPPPQSVPDRPLRTAHIIAQLNQICASERYVVTCDVGDCLYASVDLRTDQFLGPGYYNSMGFGVPAGLAVPLARPDRRAIVLVGDGGFQMTGLELSTARRLGQNPIVILFDNGGYAMMKTIAGHKSYFDLPAWDYPSLARALGGRGVRVETAAELRSALQAAEQSSDFFLIDAVLDPDDVSPTWRRITEGIRARIGRS